MMRTVLRDVLDCPFAYMYSEYWRRQDGNPIINAGEPVGIIGHRRQHEDVHEYRSRANAVVANRPWQLLPSDISNHLHADWLGLSGRLVVLWVTGVVTGVVVMRCIIANWQWSGVLVFERGVTREAPLTVSCGHHYLVHSMHRSCCRRGRKLWPNFELASFFKKKIKNVTEQWNSNFCIY